MHIAKSNFSHSINYISHKNIFEGFIGAPFIFLL